METKQSIFNLFIQKIKNLPRTRENLFSYITLILFVFLIIWLIIAGFFILFGINIFWTKDPLIAFYSIASVNVIFAVYSTYLNKKRLTNKELVSPERRYQEEN